MILMNPQLRPQPLQDGDLSKSMESSPLLVLLKDMNNQLRGHAEKAGIFRNKEPKKGRDFKDVFDARLTCNTDLIPIHPENLPAREFVIYQFGVRLLQLVKCNINAPEIKLCVAASLPQNDYQGNAFSNSFFYQKSEKTLFVSRAYLESVGSFGLLLVHCAAHITADNINQDSDPLFLRLFYQALKVCFSDAFLVNLKMSAVLQDTKTSKQIYDVLLNGEPFSPERRNLLSELFLAKVHSPTDNQSSKESLENTKKLLSHQKCEKWVKCKLSDMKREYFTQAWNRKNLKSNKREELEDSLDILNEALLKILKTELHSKVTSASEDHLAGIHLEKQCLLKEIEKMEAKIAKEEGHLQ